MTDRTPMPAPPPVSSEDLDDPARRLWSRWRRGQPTRVEDFLAQAGIQDPAQILEVLLVDQAERFRLGEFISAETYLDAFPAVRDDPERAVDLIFTEYLLREERGESLAPEDYLHRFPQHAAALRLQFELHQAVGTGGACPPTRAEDLATGLDGHRAAVPAGPEVLPSIPGYDVSEVLGRGGMGVVYRAWQGGLGRWVALKMVHAGAQASPQVLARFKVEAEAVARLQHPHIVQVHDVGRHADSPFLVLELVEGENLAQRVAGTPQPARWAAELVETLARAIHAAHQQGVVHRDLTPANVLLTADGTPKITDFGLAKLLLGGEGMGTMTGELLGTPSYMAPEQAAGRQREIGAATDVYALGAILYELLTGRPPFRAAAALETLQQVQTTEPVPPSRLVPGLPRDAETVALKCLHKDPTKRYESAAALAEDLRRYRAGEPIVARPVGAPERAWRWCKRNPLVAGLTAAVLLLFVAGFAGVTWNYWGAEAARRELESTLYFQRIALAHRELSVDNLRRALELLDQCPEGLRQWEWHYLTRLCRVEPLVLHDPGKAEVSSVAFSPDGERLASAGGDGTVKVWSTRTGKVIQTLDAQTDFVFSVAFHPGGEYLASAGANREVSVWDLTTGKTVFTCPGYVGLYYGTAYGVAFSPDGRWLAAGSEGAVNLWDWRNHKLLHTLPGHGKQGISVAFSPDGRRLATGSSSGDVMIWHAETGDRLYTLVGHRHEVSAVAFSPDGRRLVSASFDRHLIVWDATTGLRVLTFRGHDGLVVGVAFSPDGRRLASAGQDKTVRLWDAATGREVLGLRGHTALSQCVAFSPDGRRLASAGRDATIRLWDATPVRGDEGQEALTFSQHAGEVLSLTFSPDGQRMASAGLAPPGRLDAPVEVWDVRSGEVSAEFTGHTEVVLSVAWHPDGQRIASAGRDQAHDLFVVKVWDAATGRQAFSLPADVEMIRVVAFGPDGRFLVTGGANRTVEVWDAQTGYKVGVLGAHDREIRGLAFSRDGRHLASASIDGAVKLWDATRLGEKQVARGPFHAHGAQVALRLAFSPDGKRLVVGGEENTVKIWDVPTGRELRTLRGHSGDVWAVAFSPDPGGRWVASAGEDSTVKIWDSHASTLLRSFRGHTGYIHDVAFSPDGRLLASASHDRTVKLWDLTYLNAKPAE
jgi:WD40 repeat protein